MVVQVSHFAKDNHQKDFNESSDINLIFSEINKDEEVLISDICEKTKIKKEISASEYKRIYLTIPINSLKEFKKEINKSSLKNSSHSIHQALDNYYNYTELPVVIGDSKFNEPLVMGILNVTPDSFSDGGKYINKDKAVRHALNMFENGADIVDIGGESTRPGSDSVSEDEELKRVIPVIEEILKKKPAVIISVDTTKSKVAEEACSKGAKIINDISGLTFDSKIAEVANDFNAALIIMHMKGTPKTMQVNPAYDDLIPEIYEFLWKQTESARKAGAKNLIVDPGIGFGKKAENNFEILKRISDFKSLGYPILIGLSRKSFLGKAFDLEIMERDNITSVAEAIALRNGSKIIRTHNVINAVRTKNLLKLIYN